ncbi:MAG TPA: cell division protein ZapA, partial [Methylothermaceae bacterium]|nr:cell division protein ZapA [Methylothermaceae bacterium]
MTDSPVEPVSVKIMGREYRLRCPASETATLIAAAQYL